MSAPTQPVPAEIVAALGGSPPTPEQWAAIAMPLEPYVLVAGAGSGKTSVMAARVVYLGLVALGRIEADHPGVMPGNLLCLTFTVKATENLRSRIRRALAGVDLPEGEEPEILNYHGLAQQVIDRYGMLAGIEPGQRVLTQAQRVDLAGRVLDEMTFERVKTEWQPTVVEQILKLDEQAQNHLVDPQTIVDHNLARLDALTHHRSDRAYRAAQERIELAQAVGVFRRLKRDLGVIDFGDQIELAMRVATQHPDVGTTYRERFAAVLLDEYQDTNVAQARLMEALFGGGHPVTAVGDPDQNIYAWRGASLYNLLEFPERFRTAEDRPAARMPLFTNFRSGARILHAADAIIAPLPEEQRPDPEKTLVPWPANGEGEVTLAAHLDELTEARWIAARIVELHDAGSRWSDIAVLCRTSRLFDLLQQSLDELGVPAEIVGLAGLLRVPEVVEVLAYARAANDPMASTALARILMGPRYRVGFKDIALVAGWAKAKNYAWREAGADDEETPFLLAEALEHLDEVEGISEEGRARLQEFAAELAELRHEARRPVGEFMGEVVRRIGILDELESDVDRASGAQRARNLAAFLDQVHGFEPIEGELTLRVFLDYVDAVEELDKEDWAPVQPSDEDAVKVMTIHQAKGLEFDHVFVPGVATGLMPSKRIQQNPAERGYSLDFELRGDAAILPAFDGVLSHFKHDLQRQEVIEERRTMYVALTRARKTLWVSASTWYGENVNARGASEFHAELVGWAQDSGEASIHDDKRTGDGGGDELNPMLGYRLERVRDWPGPARRDEADALFVEGWRQVAADAVAAGAVQAGLLESLPEADRASFEVLVADRRRQATHLREREGADDGGDGLRVPRTLSASALMEHARCPKRFYWTSVRPLPRFSGPAARIGTEIHRWIERRASGQGQLLEPDDTVDLTQEELAGDPGAVGLLRQAFLDSDYVDRTPLHAERAFLLRVGDFVVGGRIDAIFGEPDGPWEIVDWKTGNADADPMQLEVYGLACVEVWGKRPEELTLTYFYLRRGEASQRPMGDPAEIRARVETSLSQIAAGEFAPTPGAWCGYCDFKGFCDAGRAWLAQNG